MAQKETSKKESRWRKFKVILDSATFALLLSLGLFSYEMINGAKETEEIVQNLTVVQNSLSTRYLGLFPQYINNINNLLDDAVQHQGRNNVRDSIIIFEDVLYYGIKSDPDGFRLMIENLLNLSNYGCHITIAYYNPDGIPFKTMVRDKLISYDNQRAYHAEMDLYRKNLRRLRGEFGKLPHDLSREEVDKAMTGLIEQHMGQEFKSGVYGNTLHQFMRNINNYVYVDSVMCQKYYDITRNASTKKFTDSVNDYLTKLPQDNNAIDAVASRVNALCHELDDIKKENIGKQVNKITYADYYNMYKDMTDAISRLLDSQPNIEMIPLDETLMMSCWMTIIDGKERAIFAFPSKYSTEEIGFTSQDIAIANYIHTMLKGIKNSQRLQ